MELVERALPAVEEHADQAAESACLLADAVNAGGWSAVAADDALTAIETLAEALGGIGPELQDVLAAATAASTARRGVEAHRQVGSLSRVDPVVARVVERQTVVLRELERRAFPRLGAGLDAVSAPVEQAGAQRCRSAAATEAAGRRELGRRPG
ncbi:hypothetical protein [Streptomyces sp. NPDC058664]|uniref:hypothetical protein n=1 Tax=unclassified Streptomyces TaxID=2593676 RepID=UPI0036573826